MSFESQKMMGRAGLALINSAIAFFSLLGRLAKKPSTKTAFDSPSRVVEDNELCRLARVKSAPGNSEIF